jgi:hypothetical protein
MVSWPEQAGEERLKYNAQLRDRFNDPEGREGLTEQEVARAEVLLARDKKKKKGKADLKRRIEEKNKTKAARAERAVERAAEAEEAAKHAPPADHKRAPPPVRTSSSGRGGSFAGRGRGAGRAAVDRGGRRSRGRGDKRTAVGVGTTHGKQRSGGVEKK